MNNSFDVIGLGAILLDHAVIVPEFPKENYKIKIQESFQELGGPVPTALTILKKLGKNVNFIGTIGDDHVGEQIKRVLKKGNVSTDNLLIQKEKISGFAHVWINESNGSRTVAYSSGTLNPISKNEILSEYFDNAKILHIDSREPIAALRAADIAHEKGMIVSVDTGDLKPHSEELIKKADIIIAPQRFAIELHGIEDLKEAAKKLRSFGADIAVVTAGEKGLGYSSAEGAYFQENYKIKAIDTNGAGDIFCGAFLNGILEKKNINENIRFASAAAALKCSKMGKSILPDYNEINQLANI